jgi:type II secretory pathway pseudopilin PulG
MELHRLTATIRIRTLPDYVRKSVGRLKKNMPTGKSDIIMLKLRIRNKTGNLNMSRVYRKLHFTLIELLMAMAVFTIISLIMMRFFNSAQQIYSKVNQKNSFYSDARIALDLIARDLQCAMYNNEDTTQGVCPFWFQKVRDITSNYYPAPASLEQTQLNLIVVTDMKPSYAQSTLCEIRYGFVPADVLPPGTNPYAIPAAESAETNSGGANISIGEGWLVRSCIFDKNPDASVNAHWDFYAKPRRNSDGTLGSDTRVVDVFATSAAPDSHSYRAVIPGVYELKFTCYVLDPATGYHVTIKPMMTDGSLSTTSGTFGVPSVLLTASPRNGNINTFIGTPFPVAVKIDLSLMAPSDWREWHDAVDRVDTSTANRIKQQRMRTFSRTVFLDNKVSY